MRVVLGVLICGALLVLAVVVINLLDRIAPPQAPTDDPRPDDADQHEDWMTQLRAQRDADVAEAQAFRRKRERS